MKPFGLTFRDAAISLNQMVLDQSPSLDRVFHALAHPARRAILRQLTQTERNLSELSTPLKMSFPAASKHVRVLERARLVRRRVVGRSHMCRLNPVPIKQINEWTEGYRALWEHNFQQLDDLLASIPDEPTTPAPRPKSKKKGTP